MRYLEFYVNFPRDCQSVVCQGLLVFCSHIWSRYHGQQQKKHERRVICKVIQTWHKNPSFIETMCGTWNSAWRNTKRINRVSNSYKDQKWGSNEFGPLFVPIENICHWSALHPSVYGCVCVWESLETWALLVCVCEFCFEWKISNCPKILCKRERVVWVVTKEKLRENL